LGFGENAIPSTGVSPGSSGIASHRDDTADVGLRSTAVRSLCANIDLDFFRTMLRGVSVRSPAFRRLAAYPASG